MSRGAVFIAARRVVLTPRAEGGASVIYVFLAGVAVLCTGVMSMWVVDDTGRVYKWPLTATYQTRHQARKTMAKTGITLLLHGTIATTASGAAMWLL
ncbi:hypothetical protein [Rhodococcus opacus]|uniref:hypothetical protein n=1 Tax=Rhodococcus opacus TaxID=37919 RepID=UPI00146F73D0|nr:hypothetical protein [Rhodococcus opacus]MDV6245145.1 hypothetical protein [Rhodococcus opacus]